MDRPSEPQRFASLLGRLLRRGWPEGVHVVQERGVPAAPAKGPVSVLDYPRLSLCLSGRAKYTVVREGRWSAVTLQRGEVIVTAPGCVMEPHEEARYLALGIVFTPEMTRFLLARKVPGLGRPHHRFLLAHHSAALIDEETRLFFQAVAKGHLRPPEDRYLRGLVELILIKAREMAEAKGRMSAGRKAALTWQAARQFVREHLHHAIGREEVAAFLRVHPNHLSRLFAEFSGSTFSEYLRTARLELGRELLRDPGRNVREAAKACGFSDANYFIRCYRKAYGVTPGRGREGG